VKVIRSTEYCRFQGNLSDRRSITRFSEGYPIDGVLPFSGKAIRST
jgi:hypothetical protein